MEVIKEKVANYKQMAITEKYETTVVSYLRKYVRNIPNTHAVERAMVKQCLHGQMRLFYLAGKSNLISRINDADAGLADLRYWLRFMVDPEIKALPPEKFDIALMHVAEVGGMINKWIDGHDKRRGQHG